MAQKLLIQGGHVLLFAAGSTSTDPRISFQVKDVLVEGNIIVSIEDVIAAPPGATVIDAHDHIVSPGFVDTHRHMWQIAARSIVRRVAFGDVEFAREYLYGLKKPYASMWNADDLYWGQLVGACEALSAGVTTVLDHSHGATFSQEHVRRCLDAIRESGIRCIYAYSKVNEETWGAWQSEQIVEIGLELQTTADQRITLGLGYDSIVSEPPDIAKETLATAAKAGSSLTTMHVATPLSQIQEHLSSSFVFSHMNHASSADMELVRELGAGVACTPDTGLAMGHEAFHCAENGIRAGFGNEIHTCSGDMFAQMRHALQSVRATYPAALPPFTSGRDVPLEKRSGGLRSLPYTEAHALRFATLGGAEVLKMDDKIGSLEVGKLADLAIISLSSPAGKMLGVAPDDGALSAAMVMLANPSDVKTVVINGEVVKQSGELRRVRWEDVVIGFGEQQRGIHAKWTQIRNGVACAESENRTLEKTDVQDQSEREV